MNIRVLTKGNAADIRVFKSLPFHLYKNNPYWVPPMPGEIERVMSPERHPFYAHSDADFLIVEDNNKVLGRIAVLQNLKYCEFHNENIAFVYYFESINNEDCAKMLFSTAENWAVQKGCKKIMGPRGFLRSNCMGLLIDGFNQDPAMGSVYNLPYYPDLMESCGYVKSFDHFSGYLDKHPDPIIHKIAEKVLSHGNFHVLGFTTKQDILEWIPKVDEVHHRAFANNPNFYPSTPEEFKLLAENIVAIANPNYLKVIMYQDQVAGFIVAYPNINSALRRSRGKLFPIGWLMLLIEKQRSRVIDLNGVGLLPEYQGLGGNALLYSELDKVLYATRFKKGEVVQVDERNFRSKSDMQTLGVNWSKTHRTYSKQI